MEQNQKLLKRVATLDGRVEAQEEHIWELYRRTNDLRTKSMDGRGVQGFILGNALVDQERINSHAERIFYDELEDLSVGGGPNATCTCTPARYPPS
ncbi:hypothetical protein Hanom_Chr10g00901431 [Helianthus anomalus]